MQEGYTPLHYAAKEGHANVAAALLVAKADVNTKDEVRPCLKQKARIGSSCQSVRHKVPKWIAMKWRGRGRGRGRG